jgi:hypothetical protein
MQLVYRLTLFVGKPLSSAPPALDETQPKRSDTRGRSELAHQRLDDAEAVESSVRGRPVVLTQGQRPADWARCRNHEALSCDLQHRDANVIPQLL